MNPNEVEWQAQERAVALERQARTMVDEDPIVARYRVVARALSRAPTLLLPDEFARVVAARAAARAELDTRFEQRLVIVLIAAMIVSGLVVAAIYSPHWTSIDALVVPGIGAAPLTWWVAVLACVGMSWAFGTSVSRSLDR